jgi:signal peptidase I
VAFRNRSFDSGGRGRIVRHLPRAQSDENERAGGDEELSKSAETSKKKSNLSFFIILAAVVASLVLVRVFLIDWINVSGESMLPTLQDGELLLVNKTKHTGGDLEYGDIVVVKYPDSETQFVKRVIGKAGDTVEIRDSILYLNGKAQSEAYIYDAPFADMKPVTVTEGSIFVMGDNRNHSSDSREVGSIPDEKIVGNAMCVLFPFDNARSLY